MGDRCYVSITVRRDDVEKWEALDYMFPYDMEGYADGPDGDSKHVELIDGERNCGVSDDDGDLVPGCPMFGYHEAGGDYGAMLFAYDGETFMEHERGDYGMPVIECGPNGPSAYDVENAKQFLAFQRRVANMVCGEGCEQQSYVVGQTVEQDTAAKIDRMANLLRKIEVEFGNYCCNGCITDADLLYSAPGLRSAIQDIDNLLEELDLKDQLNAE